MKNLELLLRKKTKKYLLYHFGAVIIFAVLYWITDVFEINDPKFSKKYLGESKIAKAWKSGYSDSFLYYLWFSLVSQTTVGYGGLTDPTGNDMAFPITDYPFKILNILQLSSIFLIPIFAIL